MRACTSALLLVCVVSSSVAVVEEEDLSVIDNSVVSLEDNAEPIQAPAVSEALPCADILCTKGANLMPLLTENPPCWPFEF